jgi:hypothetical protein
VKCDNGIIMVKGVPHIPMNQADGLKLATPITIPNRAHKLHKLCPPQSTTVVIPGRPNKDHDRIINDNTAGGEPDLDFTGYVNQIVAEEDGGFMGLGHISSTDEIVMNL